MSATKAGGVGGDAPRFRSCGCIQADHCRRLAARALLRARNTPELCLLLRPWHPTVHSPRHPGRAEGQGSRSGAGRFRSGLGTAGRDPPAGRLGISHLPASAPVTRSTLIERRAGRGPQPAVSAGPIQVALVVVAVSAEGLLGGRARRVVFEAASPAPGLRSPEIRTGSRCRQDRRARPHAGPTPCLAGGAHPLLPQARSRPARRHPQRTGKRTPAGLLAYRGRAPRQDESPRRQR